MRDALKSSFNDVISITQQFCASEDTLDKTENCARHIADAFSAGSKVLICGNGGSACDSMHFAEEFTGRYRKDRKALPVISLTDPSHITCVGNDFGFDQIFARGVEAYGTEGDIFIGLSTSGNSQNIINATKCAQDQGLFTILLLGKDGGKLAGQGDIEFIVPATTSDRIQELHMAVLHIVIEGVERLLFPELY
jgi:D-sedoheptulose 7-phosphate isomerase